MITFFEAQDALIYAVKATKSIDQQYGKKAFVVIWRSQTR